MKQKENAITPQLVEQIRNDIFSTPWGHHVHIIDKFKEQPLKWSINRLYDRKWSIKPFLAEEMVDKAC